MTTYLALKSLHVLGVVVFLGNIIVTGVWKALADRTRSAPIVAYSQRLVPQRYWKLATTWNVAGAVATLLPLANIYFMVFKPA
jgi:uncharacterized membrane protein